MPGLENSKQFVFANRHEDIYPFLMDIVSHTVRLLPQHVNTQKVISKIKLIIVELLTNGIKHSGQDKVWIDLVLTKDHLEITKTDYGYPFSLIDKKKEQKVLWPGHGNVNRKIEIYSDGLNGLLAESVSENQLRFYTEEYSGEGALGDIAEHFGLMIVAKLTGDFVYRYDEISKSNVFTMKLNFE